jgi:uncharacterized protein YndB with AHSA1/START domain
MAEDREVLEVTTLVPGGRYSVEVSEDSTVTGQYVEVDPPRRIVFTWGWEGSEEVPPGSSTVEVTREEDRAPRSSGFDTSDFRATGPGLFTSRDGCTT